MLPRSIVSLARKITVRLQGNDKVSAINSDGKVKLAWCLETC